MINKDNEPFSWLSLIFILLGSALVWAFNDNYIVFGGFILMAIGVICAIICRRYYSNTGFRS